MRGACGVFSVCHRGHQEITENPDCFSLQAMSYATLKHLFGKFGLPRHHRVKYTLSGLKLALSLGTELGSIPFGLVQGRG